MALMVPDSIPSKASQGEKTLYGVLRDYLPDDFYVWYEPNVGGLYPDFIVLGPSLGLLILEVKGWYAGDIVKADNNFFQIKWKRDGVERIESHQSPLRQGHNYFATVADKLKRYSVLVQHEGDYKGSLVFPVGVGAVMSNITASKSTEENIYPLLPQPQVVYRDELLEWEQYSERKLISRLKEIFKVYFPFYALTDDQISTIKGVIHPETVVKEVLATPKSVPTQVILQPDSTIIKTLDAKQETVAKEMRSGHRLLSGVAGGGKTIILLSRAKKLAKEEGKRILIVCFNITLAAYLRSLLHEDDKNPHYRDRIEVMHFNDWAKSILKRLPNPQMVRANQQDYDEVLGQQLLEAINKLQPEQKWDSILVDEAHTFCPIWFKCCVNALKDPENSDLLIVFDGNQTLYKRRKFTWKSVDIKAVGRTKRLNQNYRNTQEILEAAWSLVKSIKSENDSQGEMTFSVVEPTAALRKGVRPTLKVAQSRQKEFEAIIQQVQQLVQAGYEPKDIAILYRKNTYQDNALLQQLIQQLEHLGFGAYWVTDNNNQAKRRNYSTKQPGVRIITGLSSLGLEFKAVLIIWLEQYADCISTDKETAALTRRQLYVAMTRAQEQLYLFGSRNVRLMDELYSTGCFEVRASGTEKQA
ncbi:hypothetical protein NIES4106_60420 (plasmid) [Fischerella sp. NIES-4106]|nr:hypothetical protein NIES4106_60420 [Fischerella sp. NIES-4106]